MTKILDVVSVRCSEESHLLGITDRGQIVFLGHPNVRLERQLQRLGSPSHDCFYMAKHWFIFIWSSDVFMRLAKEARDRGLDRANNKPYKDPMTIRAVDRFNLYNAVKDSRWFEEAVENYKASKGKQ